MTTDDPPTDDPYASVEGLTLALDGPVLTATLDRAEARNAINDTMIDGLVRALEAAGEDEAVRAIVITGANGQFCSGADIVARNRPGGEKPRVGSIQRRLPHRAHRLVPTILTVQVPVVAVVRGWASGLGFHLALAADFCVADTAARFWEPFLTRGFTPDSGATWLLPRIAGVARARELLLLGRELTGEEAAAWGLIHEAAPDVAGEAGLDARAEALVAQLAAAPTVAVGLTKLLINRAGTTDLDSHLRDEAYALELSSRTLDFREGLAAFRERRDPRFEGR